jgi:hypothetical protein
VANGTTERRHAWFEGSLLGIRDPFLDAHPHHREAVDTALALIARDPYALVLRRYLGDDATGEAYVYAVPGTNIEIVFVLIRQAPGKLGLFQILDWEDVLQEG